MDLMAHVPRDIADLVSGFLRNRQAEVQALRTALALQDIHQLIQLGERMYALGNPYGFRQITTFGRQLREACAAQSLTGVGQIIEEYWDYLSKVEIVEVDAPVLRSQWRERADRRGAAQALRIKAGDAGRTS